ISGKPFPYFWVLQGTIKLKNFLENNITPACSYDGSYLKLVAPNSIVTMSPLLKLVKLDE
ncbi:hypothetical protein, partial [Enterococcus faecalis]|uniref:hypothetical protein n=1 Tax=Enterococcus faecalis TaxID=1351 RepID=UPI003D6A1E0A